MLLSPCIGASFLARKLVWIRKNCLLAMVVDYGKFVNEYCICVGIVGVMQVCCLQVHLVFVLDSKLGQK